MTRGNFLKEKRSHHFDHTNLGRKEVEGAQAKLFEQTHEHVVDACAHVGVHVRVHVRECVHVRAHVVDACAHVHVCMHEAASAAVVKADRSR